MNVLPIGFAALLLLGCLVLTASLWRRSHTEHELAASSTADELTAAVARHLSRTYWLAWPLAVGLATASLLAFGNHAVIAAPVLLMLGIVVAYAVGEATAPVPSRATARSASLEPRDPIGYLTPRRRAVWIGSMVVAVIVTGSAVILADETGRSLSLTCAAGGQTVSPFPGLAYGAPGLLALLPVQLNGFLAFRRIINRPATSLESAAPADRLCGSRRLMWW